MRERDGSDICEAADCALKEAEALTETAMKTCQLQDGPELYLEALEKI